MPVSADILENTIRKHPQLLDALLKDHSATGKSSGKSHNIIWATDSYARLGKRYAFDKPITKDLITGKHGQLIQPRVAKSKEEQKKRTVKNAEVFTPLNIVDRMNKMIDWADEERPGKPAGGKQPLSGEAYISRPMLEVACGEAPFIASRYNPVGKGEVLALKGRVGFLDRKLREVARLCRTTKGHASELKWLDLAKKAFRASYGFEWQGDNLLIARENLLYTFIDYWNEQFPKDEIDLARPAIPPYLSEKLLEIAEIISWNLFQMDGIKFVVPMSCGQQKAKAPAQQSLFARLGGERVEGEVPPAQSAEVPACPGCAHGDPFRHVGRYARVMDWGTGKPCRFADLLRVEKTDREGQTNEKAENGTKSLFTVLPKNGKK